MLLDPTHDPSMEAGIAGKLLFNPSTCNWRYTTMSHFTTHVFVWLHHMRCDISSNITSTRVEVAGEWTDQMQTLLEGSKELETQFGRLHTVHTYSPSPVHGLHTVHTLDYIQCTHW